MDAFDDVDLVNHRVLCHIYSVWHQLKKLHFSIDAFQGEKFDAVRILNIMIDDHLKIDHLIPSLEMFLFFKDYLWQIEKKNQVKTTKMNLWWLVAFLISVLVMHIFIMSWNFP